MKVVRNALIFVAGVIVGVFGTFLFVACCLADQWPWQRVFWTGAKSE